MGYPVSDPGVIRLCYPGVIRRVIGSVDWQTLKSILMESIVQFLQNVGLEHLQQSFELSGVIQGSYPDNLEGNEPESTYPEGSLEQKP